MSSTTVDTSVLTQLTTNDGQTAQFMTQPIHIEYKTPQQSLEDALNFREQSTDETRNTQPSSTNTITRRQIANASNSGDGVAAATAAAATVGSLNPNIATNSMCKMKDFVNTMMRKMNDTKYLYPSMAVLIMAIIVIIVLFQKISVIVKIICVVLLIVFMAATVVQFKQF